MTLETDALAAAGLTPNEAKVYLALLESGPTTTGPLRAKTGLHIPRIYDALRGLEHKGLVSSVMRNNRHHFEAADPQRLVDIEEEKANRLQKMVPELTALRSPAAPREAAMVFKGVRGLRSVLDSILHDCKNGGGYVDFGVSTKFKAVMGPYWYVWQSTKPKWKIHSRVICDEKVRGNLAITEYLKASPFHQARYVPGRYHCPSDTFIWKNKIAIFIWDAKPPTVVVMEDAATAQGYRNVFEWMWKMAKK